MARIIQQKDIAVIEFPKTEHPPEFEIMPDGALMIFGYETNWCGQILRSSKRFDFKLHGYEVVGLWNDIPADSDVMIEIGLYGIDHPVMDQDFDLTRTVITTKGAQG